MSNPINPLEAADRGERWRTGSVTPTPPTYVPPRRHADPVDLSGYPASVRTVLELEHQINGRILSNPKKREP